MSLVPICTPGWRETKWSKVPCLRKESDRRGLSPGPPDPEFEVLFTHTSTHKMSFQLAPKTFGWAELISQYFCNLNASENCTCPSVFTSPIAKSTSPRLSDTIFFARCFTFHLQYKRSGMFANRNLEELSYPQNLKMCDPILVTLLEMRPHYSQSSHENVTLSISTSPLDSHKEVAPPPPGTLTRESSSREVRAIICTKACSMWITRGS